MQDVRSVRDAVLLYRMRSSLPQGTRLQVSLLDESHSDFRGKVFVQFVGIRVSVVGHMRL